MIIFVFSFCQVFLLASSIYLLVLQPDNCLAPTDSAVFNFLFYSWTRSCSFLLWVYAIMFLFWPVQLTHEIASWFGIDISPPKQQLASGPKVDNLDDSDDSDENEWRLNANGSD